MTTTRIGINGFGRIRRLVLRAAWAWPELEVVHVDEVTGGVDTAAHLLTFDSVHGRWPHDVHGAGDALSIDGTRVGFSEARAPGHVPRGEHGVDLVLECSGRFRTPQALGAHLTAGVRKVVVAAPVKTDALNVVVGVNDDLYDPDRHDLLTAASCTTNCLAPLVEVLHEGLGIRRGSITTLHDV